jgi:Lrp/AsnC family leucine-responsive transcriptional regulator
LAGLAIGKRLLEQKMPEHRLDAADRRILEHLQVNGRLTNLELAEKIGLSPSPCLRRVRALEEAGYIAGYTARLNRRKLGLGITAFVLVQLDRHGAVDAEAMRAAITALPEIIACYVTSGEFDLLLQVVVRDLDEYRRFSLEGLLAVRGIRDIRTSFVIDAPIDGRPIALDHLR